MHLIGVFDTHNNKVDEIESLARISSLWLPEKDRLLREGEDRAKQVEARIQRENLTRKVSGTAMKELWHSMSTRARNYTAFLVR